MIPGYPQPEKGKYKVFVQTLTYNQSEYIVDTFNGVVMQQTSFPFVHVVYDDCSTDDEQDVIKKWLVCNCQMDNAVWYDNELAEIVEVKHTTNFNLTVVVYFFKRNLDKEGRLKRTQITPWREVCDYEAICEGDDYWIDSEKLQKQVDFLDQNPDYGLIHTNNYVVDGKNRKLPKVNRTYSSGDVLFKILGDNYHITTLTALYRTDLYNSLPKLWIGKGFGMGDLPLWIELARVSKIKYIPDVCGSYRWLMNSASHGTDIEKEINFHRGSLRCRKFYCEEFGISYSLFDLEKKFLETIIKISYNHRNVDISRKYFEILKNNNYRIGLRTKMFYYATINKPIYYLSRILYKIMSN